MKPSEKIAGVGTGVGTGVGDIWNLLVVDVDAKVADVVRKAAGCVLSPGKPVTVTRGRDVPAKALVRAVDSLGAAEAELAKAPADVIFLNLEMAGRQSTDLIRRFRQRFPSTEVVALSKSKKGEACLDAWRAGAGDYIQSPVAVGEMERVLGGAAARHFDADRRHQRYRRLREACRRLNRARHEISQQVDLLCNDLVRAYQEMAHQLNLTQTAAEYAQVLAHELDVEGVLRRTMEWVLRKLGPVNAAIYLPAAEGSFALGAYLNLDTQADGALIDALGKTIIAQARGATPMWVEEDGMLDELFGDDARLLLGKQWLAVGCNTPRECLAVLVVFRNKQGSGAAELTASSRGLMEAVAPILAEKMEQALGLYQRLHPYSEEEQEES